MTDELDLGRIGRCIYCGATEDLTDEHPIPYSLGGGAQLFDASCRACADITSKFERRVAQRQLGAFRTITGLPTYHKNKRPTTFRANVRRGAVWAYEDLPVEKFTAVAPFPKLPVPAAAEGLPPRSPIRLTGTVNITVVKRADPEPNPARRFGADAIDFDVSIELGSFMRLLAKIAYGYSVALFGVDRVLSEVLGIILGTDGDLGRWVGCPPPEWSAFASPTSTHMVRVMDVQGICVAWIRMFGQQGAPEYFVIVGRLQPVAEGV
jgi:hypothetical protein